MKKLLIGLLGATVLGTGGYAAASGLDDAQPARTVSIPAATTIEDTTTQSTTTGTTSAETTTAATKAENEVEDISGPCDEAEHANDPRCNGGVDAGADDDHFGRSHDDNDDNGDDHHEDRSGSNSGRR
jgi:hypothetical protein